MQQQPERPERIVFLGDSITDGHTYQLLVQQALAEAGRPVPTGINAGVASDTAAMMLSRLDRDVLVHRPSLVCLSAGINDVGRGVSVADYAAAVTTIARHLATAQIPLMVLTTSVYCPDHPDQDQVLSQYNAVLRDLAKQFNGRVAEVNERMQEARAAGCQVLESATNVHPNFEGNRIIARAVLDALGEAGVAVPRNLHLEPVPGLIRDWQFRVGDRDVFLDETAVRNLTTDTSWKRYWLPETNPVESGAWWEHQEQQRGFAVSIAQLLGEGKLYQGMSTFEEQAPRQFFFNTGARVQTVWFNGERLFRAAGWTGWHAGKERLPAQSRVGQNVVVIETDGSFFLSMTPDNQW